MQDRPTAAELLATLTEYLQGEVLPNVQGTLRYHTLVAANLTRMLEREMLQYPSALSAERTALCSLLRVVPVGEPTEQVASLNAELATRLGRNGDADADFERAAWRVLSDACAAKLAMSKPGYDGYDMAREVR